MTKVEIPILLITSGKIIMHFYEAEMLYNKHYHLSIFSDCNNYQEVKLVQIL